jgi:hypothetical protein
MRPRMVRSLRASAGAGLQSLKSGGGTPGKVVVIVDGDLAIEAE